MNKKLMALAVAGAVAAPGLAVAQTSLTPQALVPAPRIAVAESGILTPNHVGRLRSAGVQAFLVGEAFMRAPDPGLALAGLFLID